MKMLGEDGALRYSVMHAIGEYADELQGARRQNDTFRPYHACSLRDVMRGRTTIVNTHRLIGLDMADEILVMQDGRIQERGMHYELLQAEGLYRKLWTVQNQAIASDV